MKGGACYMKSRGEAAFIICCTCPIIFREVNSHAASAVSMSSNKNPWDALFASRFLRI